MFRETAVAALVVVCATARHMPTAHKVSEDVFFKRDGGHGRDHAASNSGYGFASQSYEEPTGSYGAPYGAPETGYGAPSASYGPVSYYEEEAMPNLAPFITAIFVLAGLYLLTPTYVSLSSVRRKRHAEDDVNPMTDVVERVNDIYSSVVASEDCMERIACEVGGLAADFGLTQSPTFKLAYSGFARFAPSKYKSYFMQFHNGKDCHRIKCGIIA